MIKGSCRLSIQPMMMVELGPRQRMRTVRLTGCASGFWHAAQPFPPPPPLTLVSPPPPTPPNPVWLRARELRSTHPRGCVCVGGGFQLVTLGGGGGQWSYTHPIVPRLCRAQVSSTPQPHSRRFFRICVNVVRLYVAFGLMSFGLMSPSA